MQILLGAHETIIKVNSESTKIDYIQHFIHQNFNDVMISKKVLYIPASHNNPHYRVFLLKWLYALYVKRTKNDFFELKETLLNRHHKAIKILLTQEITYKIIWNIIDAQNIAVKIEPYSHSIINILQAYFKTALHVTQTHCSIHISSPKEKELVKKLLNSSEIISMKYKHIFNTNQMNEFLYVLSKKKKLHMTPLQKAHKVLGALPNDDASTLKKRYKQLAKKYHPDKANSKDNEKVVLYTQKFQNILQAYEMLLEQVG